MIEHVLFNCSRLDLIAFLNGKKTLIAFNLQIQVPITLNRASQIGTSVTGMWKVI